jgi:SAM-dependent methyltransferase
MRKISVAISRICSPFKFAIPLLRWINRLVRAISSATHRLQFVVEWGLKSPEYFDHNIDLYSTWRKTRESFPLERGVFSSFAMIQDARVLDLCCGDGFNAFFFYSRRAASVVAIDFDKEAIRWAKRNYKSTNLSFTLGDIRKEIPDGPFDNVIWDAAIEHFTQTEISLILQRIHSVLTPTGTLSGYTIAKNERGPKHLDQHEYEFEDKDDLARFLTPHFKSVQIFETVFPSRTNLYFHATDGDLPFSRNQFTQLFLNSD